MVDQTKEGFIIVKIDNLKESVKRANFGDWKTKAIIKELEKVRGGIELNEEFYVTREVTRKREIKNREKERRIKKYYLKHLSYQQFWSWAQS